INNSTLINGVIINESQIFMDRSYFGGIKDQIFWPELVLSTSGLSPRATPTSNLSSNWTGPLYNFPDTVSVHMRSPVKLNAARVPFSVAKTTESSGTVGLPVTGSVSVFAQVSSTFS